MKNKTKRTMLFCAVVALLTTGCGQPVFSQMKSSKPKWAMAVVAKPGDKQEATDVETLLNQLAYQEETAAVVNWTSPTAAADTIQKLTLKSGVDMILTDDAPANINQLAQKNQQIRFTVLGDASTPNLSNVRHLVLDRKRLLFLAGYLAAMANKQSSTPFSVLVDKPLATDNPDWQMILAGNHYAGRNDVPVQVQVPVNTPAANNNSTSNASGTAQGTKSAATATQPAQLPLSGKSMILLTQVNSQTLQQVRDKGMELIQTDQSGQASLLQQNVIAEPASFLQSAVQEEATAMASTQWQGGQVVTVPLTKMYNLLAPQDFPDKQINTMLEIVEEQLTNGSLKPDDYVSGSKQSS